MTSKSNLSIQSISLSNNHVSGLFFWADLDMNNQINLKQMNPIKHCQLCLSSRTGCCASRKHICIFWSAGKRGWSADRLPLQQWHSHKKVRCKLNSLNLSPIKHSIGWKWNKWSSPTASYFFFRELFSLHFVQHMGILYEVFIFPILLFFLLSVTVWSNMSGWIITRFGDICISILQNQFYLFSSLIQGNFRLVIVWRWIIGDLYYSVLFVSYFLNFLVLFQMYFLVFIIFGLPCPVFVSSSFTRLNVWAFMSSFSQGFRIQSQFRQAA